MPERKARRSHCRRTDGQNPECTAQAGFMSQNPTAPAFSDQFPSVSSSKAFGEHLNPPLKETARGKNSWKQERNLEAVRGQEGGSGTGGPCPRLRGPCSTRKDTRSRMNMRASRSRPSR